MGFKTKMGHAKIITINYHTLNCSYEVIELVNWDIIDF